MGYPPQGLGIAQLDVETVTGSLTQTEDGSLTKIIDDKTVTKIVDVVSIGNGATETSDVIELPLSGYLALTIRATYDGAATDGIRCDVFTSPDNTNWDTDTYAEFSPTFLAGATYQKTILVDPSARYIRVNVVNLDAAKDTGAVVLSATLGMWR